MASGGTSSIQARPGFRWLPGSSARVPELDGLRGMAILLVIVWHYFVAASAPQRGTFLFYLQLSGRLSWTGVDLFFVLSGFLIGGILLDARTSSHYFQVFYRRRFCRIVPIYALMCFVWWVALRPVLTNQFSGLEYAFPRPALWWVYLTYTQNFWMVVAGTMGTGWALITWSLAVEEQFYLVMPMVIRYVEERFLTYGLIFGIVLAPCLRIVLFRSLPPLNGALAAFVLMPCRADALLLGVLAALFVRRPNAWAYLLAHERHLWHALAILAVGALYLDVKASNQSDWRMVSFGYTWLALCYLCVLLIAVSQPDSFLAGALRSRLLAWFGSISYGAYLIHTAVWELAYAFLLHHSPKIRNPADVAVAFLALCLTMVIAQLSWRFFEKPIVKYGHSVGY